MKLTELEKNWNKFGKVDPMWSICTLPDKRGNKWQPDEFFESGRQEISQCMDYIKSNNINFKQKKALDFGCGVGRLTQALVQHFDEVHGVDIAGSMINLARKYNKYPENCFYYLNKKNDLKILKNNTFDFIYCCRVLQHMKPKYSLKYIREFIRILSPGGVIVFQLPSRSTLALIRPLNKPIYDAEISLTEIHSDLKSNSTAMIKVKVKNISECKWPKYIRLGNHWLDHNDKIITFDDGRVTLNKELLPGEETEVYLQIITPLQPGKYILELDLVLEGISWFKQNGSKTCIQEVILTGKSVKNKKSIIRANAAIILSHIFGKQYYTHSILTILRKFFRRRYPARPIMEMYCIPKSKLARFVENSGAKIIRIKKDDFAPEFISYTYYMTKRV